jgi:hypothetical protein
MRRSRCPSYALREKKQDLQLIAMLILINIQYYTANLFPIDNDSVRFVIGESIQRSMVFQEMISPLSSM